MLPYEAPAMQIAGISVSFWFVFHYLLAWPFTFYYIVRESMRRRDISLDSMLQLFAFIVLGSIAGARILGFFGPWSWAGAGFSDRFISMFSLASPGWVSYGGIAGGLLAAYIYTGLKGLGFLRYIDAVIPAVPLGFMIARVGCFLHGCCYGSVTEVPWAIIRNGVAIHPVQSYNSLMHLGLFILMLYLARMKDHEGMKEGFMLSSFAVAYSCLRFFTEFFRGDYGPSQYIGGIAVSQMILLIIFLVFLPLLIRTVRMRTARKDRKKRRWGARCIKGIKYFIISAGPFSLALMAGGGILMNAGAITLTALPSVSIIMILAGLLSVAAGIRGVMSR
ncbi:MAG: prolipoprotein diacylglyceryl transferase [Candidatus Woesearchaeota archaeon]